MITITHWTGRLGNNLLQILRAIYVAEIQGHQTVLLPPHYLFHTTHLFIETQLEPVNSDLKGTFFKVSDYHLADASTSILKKIAQRYRHKILPKSILLGDAEPTVLSTERKLTIHLRGGDTFSWRPHPSYVPPPLYYYNKVSSGYAKIDIVAEDNRNPLLNILKADPRFTDQSSSELRDFSKLLYASNLALNISTFSYVAYLFNTKIKNLYLPDYCINLFPPGDWPHDCATYIVDLPRYMLPGQWRNSFRQRKLLEYYTP